MTGDNGIHQEIGQTADLSQAELIASWRKLIMSPRSKGIRGFLLERAAVIRIHMRTYGGFKSTARVRLLAIAEWEDIATPITPKHCDVPGAAGQHHNCPDLDPGPLARSNVERGLQRAHIDATGK
jgi:hypothetical protein